jgi:hypothetical protein
MTSESEIAHDLRVIARLMENRKTRIDFGEQDAAVLRKAAEAIERLRAALQAVVDAKDNPELMRARVVAHTALMKDKP